MNINFNPRYIIATEVFSSSTFYAVLDESSTYLTLAEGGTKTLLASNYDKLEAIADAKQGHVEGTHSVAYGSIWRRVCKNGGLYSLVRPAYPLCDYVPASSDELLKQAIALEQARLERDVRVLQSKLVSLCKV